MVRRQKLHGIFITLLVLPLLGLVIFPLASVWAAGNAAFTSESQASVETGKTLSVNMFVTPSGASMWSGSVDVQLTGFTFQSYSSTGSPFGFAQVVAGNSAGSTSFTIGVAHTGGSGSSSKVSLGTVVLTATGAGGTSGQIQLTNAQADDFDLNPMSPSGQSRSISITAAPAGGGGGGQTNPTPNTGGGNTPTPTNPNPNKTNPVTNPNPDSTVNISDQTGNPETITEDEFSRLVEDESSGDSDAADDSKKESRLPLVIGLGVVALIAVAVVAKLLFARITSARALNRHIVSGSSAVVGGTEATQPKAPEPPSNDPQGPTIIRPQQ